MSGDVSDRLEALERRLGELEARLDDDDGIPDEWSEDTGDTGPIATDPDAPSRMPRARLIEALAAARREITHAWHARDVARTMLHAAKSREVQILEADRDRWVAEAEAYRIRAEAGFRIFVYALDRGLPPAPLGWARTHEEAKEAALRECNRRDHKGRLVWGGCDLAIWAVDAFKPDGGTLDPAEVPSEAERQGAWRWSDDSMCQVWWSKEDDSFPQSQIDYTGE